MHRHILLLVAIAAVAVPGRAEAASVTFGYSGTIADTPLAASYSNGAFGGLTGGLVGLGVTGTITFGDPVTQSSGLPGADTSSTSFRTMSLTVTVNGVTETVTPDPIPPGAGSYFVQLENGLNPPPGAAPTGRDLIFINFNGGNANFPGLAGNGGAAILFGPRDFLPGGQLGTTFRASPEPGDTGSMSVGRDDNDPSFPLGFVFFLQPFTVFFPAPDPGAVPAPGGLGLFGVAGLGLAFALRQRHRPG